MSTQPLNVFFVAGAGRGGSTLLGDILGSFENSVHLGELRGVFDYTTLPSDEIICGCGAPYNRCQFWQPVFEKVYGADWSSHVPRFRIEGQMPSARSIPWRIIQDKLRKKPIKGKIDESFDELTKVVRVVCATHGQDVVIDTSKAGPYAWMLRKQAGVCVSVVHLVRDPRASLYSWVKRAIPLHDHRRADAVMGTRGAFEAALDWIRANAGSVLLKYLGFPYRRIRYDDLVSYPDVTIRMLADFANAQRMPLVAKHDMYEMLASKKVLLSERHLIGANPGVKGKNGVVHIREDNAWVTEMPLIQRLFWTFVFLPWLILWGFRIWPMPRRPDSGL